MKQGDSRVPKTKKSTLAVGRIEELTPPYNPEPPEGMKVAVSCERTINLGDYNSVKVFVSVAGIAAGSTDEEIEEALVTGDRAWKIIMARMLLRMDEARSELAQ